MNMQGLINKDLLLEKMKEWAVKVGRISTRPALLLYYVMKQGDTEV